MTALIVEDNPEDAATYRELLEELGFAVDVKEDVEEGREAMLSGGFDLAVLDIMLPGVSGSDIILAAKRAGVKTAILCVSDAVGPRQRAEDIDNGADDHMAKPCHPYEFKARVRKIIDKYKGLEEKAKFFSVGNLRIGRVEPKGYRGDRDMQLDPDEYEFMKALVLKGGAPITYIDALKIFHYDVPIDSDGLARTVKSFEKSIQRFMKYVTHDGEKNPIKNVRGVGYALDIDATR